MVPWMGLLKAGLLSASVMVAPTRLVGSRVADLVFWLVVGIDISNNQLTAKAGDCHELFAKTRKNSIAMKCPSQRKQIYCFGSSVL